MKNHNFSYLHELNETELNHIYVATCSQTEDNVELIEYLFTNEELKHKMNIDFDNGYPLCCAFARGHTKIIKFLLTSKSLEKHANIHSKNDLPFRVLLENKNTELLEFLIIELNFQLSDKQKSISLSVVDPNKKSYVQHIISLIEKREFNKKLTNQIENLELNFK